MKKPWDFWLRCVILHHKIFITSIKTLWYEKHITWRDITRTTTVTSHAPPPAPELSAFGVPLVLHIYITQFQFDFTVISRNTSQDNTEIEGVKRETYLKPAYRAVGGLTAWHNIKGIYSSDLSSGKKAEPAVLTSRCKNTLANLVPFVFHCHDTNRSWIAALCKFWLKEH